MGGNVAKSINISIDGTATVELDKLNDFQGELKELPDAARQKLRKEIIETGFAFTPHAWLNPDDDRLYLVDGHQRVSVLRGLAAEGYDIPPIPVTLVHATTIRDAKRRVLQAASQYGQMTAQGLYDFTIINDINIDDIRTSFDFPQINMEKFNSFFEKPEEKERPGGKEIGADQFSHLIHTCPECGHRFGKAD